MNTTRSTKTHRESRRLLRKSPRLECLEDRRLLTMTWNSTSLSFFFHDNGATVTPSGQFLASQSFDIERSTDQGATWKQVADADSFAEGAIAYAPSNPTTLLAGSAKGVLKSVDGGANWFLQELNAGGTMTAITFDPKNELSVYAAIGGIAGGLFKSTDGGATWTKMRSWTNVYAVAIDPQNPDVVYIGAHADSQDPGGLLKSTDGGSTWSVVLAKDVSSVLVDPANAQVIYAGSADGGIYKSQDGGMAWKEVSGSTIVTPVTALAVDPQNDSHVFAATGGEGVFYSPDAGGAWSAINQGLTDLNIDAFSVQTASPYMVLAVTYGGSGFWATIPSNPAPLPSPPTPTPIPAPKPVPSPNPTPILGPSPISGQTPARRPIPLTPPPAPSPTRAPHKRKIHVVAVHHKAHNHPVIAHRKHKTPKQGNRFMLHPHVVRLGQIPDQSRILSVTYDDVEPVTSSI